MAASRVDSIRVWIPKLVLLSTLLLGWMRCVAALGGSKNFTLNDHLATKASSCRAGSLSTSKLQQHPTGSRQYKILGPQNEVALGQHGCVLRLTCSHMAPSVISLAAVLHRRLTPTGFASRVLPPCMTCLTHLAMNQSSCGSCLDTAADGEGDWICQS